MIPVHCRSQESAIGQARLASSHCSGIGPDKMILECFLKNGMQLLGFPFHCHIQHHFAVAQALVVFHPGLASGVWARSAAQLSVS